MADFKSLADVDAYVADHGLTALEDMVHTPGILGENNRRTAEAWLERKRAQDDRAAEVERSEREARTLKAAEDSAAATQDAARSARASARAAWAAVGISVAALLVAAWPHMPWGRG